MIITLNALMGYQTMQAIIYFGVNVYTYSITKNNFNTIQFNNILDSFDLRNT